MKCLTGLHDRNVWPVLGLTRGHFDVDGIVAAISKAPIHQVSFHPQSFDNTGWRFLEEVLLLPQIQDVGLSSCRIGVENTQKLSGFLARTYIRVLNLRSNLAANGIGVEGVTALFEVLGECWARPTFQN